VQGLVLVEVIFGRQKVIFHYIPLVLSDKREIMQSTWYADAWELIVKIFGRWQAIVGAILTVTSFIQFIPSILQYFPQANILGPIILLAGIAAIFFALVDVYREQKQKSNKLPRLIIKPSLTNISAQGGWQRALHQGDLVTIGASLEAKFSHRKRHKSSFVRGKAIPLNQNIECGHHKC
jgi:hypothetical protein